MKPSTLVSGLALAAAVLSFQASVMYFAVARPLDGALRREAAGARAQVSSKSPARPAFVELIEIAGGRRS
jgi:hypothetical protein